jgi:hypothetical protein
MSSPWPTFRDPPLLEQNNLEIEKNILDSAFLVVFYALVSNATQGLAFALFFLGRLYSEFLSQVEL